MDIKDYSVTTVDELPKVGEENKVYLLSSKSNKSVIIPDGYIWNRDKKNYEKINIEEL